MKTKPFFRRIEEKFSGEPPIWKRVFKKTGRFLFSWIGGAAVLLSLFLLFGLWIYSILGPFREFFWDIPGMAGMEKDKTYLLLLVNENELRPTGGFITSFVIVRSYGFSQDIEFYNSEDVAIPDPQIIAPYPVEKVLSRDEKYAGWVFRDTNFSLDYKENAERAIEFLKKDARFEKLGFDGVILMDTAFLGDVVDLLGPFEVEGKVLTGENLFELLEFNTKNFDPHNEEEWKKRKDFFLPLADEIRKQLFSSPTLWREFFSLLGEHAEKKHLVFYFSDSVMEKRFADKGWTGELPRNRFWAVNIANLGGRKGDRYLRKYYHSSIHVDPDGRMDEEFTLFLAHEGTYNLQSDRYEAYIRIVRPGGTVMTHSSGGFETNPLQRTEAYGEEVSFFIVLYPGEQKIITVDFTFPEEYYIPEMGRISIPIEKQIGTGEDVWDFSLRGENDMRFHSEHCDSMSPRDNVLFCDNRIDEDKILVFERHPDIVPPLLQFAQFADISTLEIRFSEEIDPNIEKGDVQLTDLDFRTGGTDEIIIRNLEIEGNSAFITFSGMVKNPGERYSFEMKNVKDISGNFYSGDSGEEGVFKITIVQNL